MPVLPQKKSRKNNSPKQQFKMITFTYDTLVLFQTFTFDHSTATQLPQPKTLSYQRLILLCGLFSLIYFLCIPPSTATSQLIDFLSYFNLFFFFFVFRWFKHVIVIFFFIFGTFLITTNTALHLLLTAELLWITLYIIVLFIGLAYDNLNFLSLTFFFLIFSAVEFGVGLILLLLQHLLTRSLNLYDNETNIFKFMNRFNRTINVNRLVWKY